MFQSTLLVHLESFREFSIISREGRRIIDPSNSLPAQSDKLQLESRLSGDGISEDIRHRPERADVLRATSLSDVPSGHPWATDATRRFVIWPINFKTKVWCWRKKTETRVLFELPEIKVPKFKSPHCKSSLLIHWAVEKDTGQRESF